MLRMKWALAIATLAVVAGVGIPRATAQPNYKGSFSLPFETYWAGTVLQPGEYTVSIEESQPGMPLLRIRGNGTVSTVLAGPMERHAFEENGRLLIVSANGTHAIKEFDTGSAGTTFTFRVPKEMQGQQLRASVTALETKVAVH